MSGHPVAPSKSPPFTATVVTLAVASVALVIETIYQLVVLRPSLAEPVDGTTLARIEDASIFGPLATISLLTFLLATVVFLTWMRRTYAAVPARRFGLGWTIGAWFVPVVNLFRPKQIVDEVARARVGTVPAVVHWWWLLSVASLVVAILSLLTGFEATAERLRADLVVFSASYVLEAVAGVLAILMVRRLR